jgi:predicted glycosyltransferase involved in capsule biosynthesis
MKMIEAFKEYIKNPLKEIQVNKIKQDKKLNKMVRDLKMERETINKT